MWPWPWRREAKAWTAPPGSGTDTGGGGKTGICWVCSRIRQPAPASVKGVQWRLSRLEKAGLFQRDIQPIERALEQRKLVVVQGPAWVLQVFSTYVTGSLYRKRRDYRDARMNGEEAAFFPPFIVVTDEAHNFAPKGMDSPAKSS